MIVCAANAEAPLPGVSPGKPAGDAPAPTVTVEASPTAAGASPRVADAALARALFAPHSWHIEPPPPPPAPPVPPPAPTAPPLPYSFLGAYTPQGGTTVYFLALADRVIDAHVGDRLDGIYEFASADANQLVFNYLPLKIKQTLPVGAKP
jgi:hypothetical protein